MDLVVEAGGLRDATASEYRNKSTLLDFTYADPQAWDHTWTGSVDQSGQVDSTSEAHNLYARPGQVSFDECSYKLATPAVESFGRLGKKGSDLIDQVVASMVGGTDGPSPSRKGVCKEHLFQIASTTTQVAISRREYIYIDY